MKKGSWAEMLCFKCQLYSSCIPLCSHLILKAQGFHACGIVKNMTQALQIALSSALRWWVPSYKLPKFLMTPSYIIKNLTQLLSLNKFRFFFFWGERKIPPGSDLAQSDGWTELAAWALNSSSSKTQRIKMCVLKGFQVKQGLSWHGNMREKLYSVWKCFLQE